nr:serine/threonine protein kinase [Pirellula sp.]
MDNSNLTDDQRDGEIASLVEFYSATFPNQNVESIDDLVRKHPHLDPELREALEAVDLFATTSFASEPKFVTGSIVGDFRIERQIGRGGMGTVYLATQLSLARSVAIKVMNFAINNSLAREEFQEEAQLVASLHYDSIVPIYASGETDGTHQQEHDGQILGGHRDLSPSCYYFAMKWIDGSSVAELIANKSADAVSRAEKRQRIRQIAAWGAKVAEALQYAHSQGVIHGDIKPSNLIVDHEQKIWLTDFGLARREEASSVCDLPVRISTEYRGTPKYMSPEQAGAIAAPVDHRTDIYSLGATLMEWLTGESLVGGRNPVESLSQLQNNSSEPPSTMLRGYSRDWIWVLEKCLARHPEERYASAAELAKDLQAISVSQPVALRPLSSPVMFFRTAMYQKKLLRAVIVSVVASLVVAFLGGNVWRNYQQSKLAPTYLDSVSGETLVVTVSDSSSNRIASLIAPSNEVLLPETESRLDVGASHRLSYSQTFNPKLAN